MPVPSAITDLSTTAASNSPAGAESARGTIDDYLRAHASFIAQTRAGTSATTYTFSATGARIQGDFSNGTPANRTAFQDKTTNNGTSIYALPNGTSNSADFTAFNNSNPANAAYAGVGITSTDASVYTSITGSGTLLPLLFKVGTEVARLATTGQFLVGTNNAAYGASNGNSKLMPTAAANVGIATGSWNNVGNAVDFFANVSGAAVYSGSISVNGSATTYGTSSDYRLKDSPQPLTGSGAFIDALQPKTWTWVGDGTAGVGFIAHEVAQVAPHTVCGEKDAVNDDGSPKYQIMEYGSAEFIANIVAELQSLRARVAALEAA
jgi:hypothetical protein